ncbi:MAG: hypothetical protein H0U40_05905 [Chloroflexia bacterium]|nr:hypothetical protein [Chloroflexia bacterium]
MRSDRPASASTTPYVAIGSLAIALSLASLVPEAIIGLLIGVLVGAGSGYWVARSGGDAGEARDVSIRYGSITALVLVIVVALVASTV